MLDDVLVISDEYKEKLNNIITIVSSLENIDREPLIRYTPHGTSHIKNLEKLLAILFPGDHLKALNDRFSDREKFILRAAIWLHDVGMFSNPEIFEDDPSAAATLPDELREWDREVRRKHHHKRSAQYILNEYRNMGLNINEARDIALVCRSHRKSQPIPEFTDNNIRLIIAYLRLLDALDIPDRPSRDFIGPLLTNLASGEMDPVSKFHWYKSFYVSEILALPEELKIIVKFALPEEWKSATDKLCPLIRSVLKDIKDEIDAVKDILIQSKLYQELPAYKYVDYDFKLTLHKKEELDDLESMLAIIRLFDTAMSPNSGEIVNIVLNDIGRDLERSDERTSKEKLQAYIRNLLDPLLIYRPCHAYLWNLKEALDQKIEDFDNQISLITDPDDRKIAQINFHRNMKNLIKALQWWRNESPDIFNIRKFININDSILLYGYSSAVIKAFNELEDDIKNKIKIYVCECNTKTKHRYNNKLIYHDGFKYIRELKKIGLGNLILTPDMCPANLFFHDTFTKNRITKVFFGANAITEDYIFHSLGHLALTQMVFAANAQYKKIKDYAQIEIFVVAEGLKIRRELDRSPENQRDDPWYPTDVCCLDNLKNIEIYNPREDVVPIKNITGIITEYGSYNTNRPFAELINLSPNIDAIVKKFEEWRDEDKGNMEWSTN